MSKWSAAFRDSRWQQKRLQVMERDKWSCVSCFDCGEGVTLNVHHAYYEAGKAPWEYPDSCLHTLCENCHKKIHELTKLFMTRIMRENAVSALEAAIGYVDGEYGPALYRSEAYSAGYVGARIASRMCAVDIKAIVENCVDGKVGGS